MGEKARQYTPTTIKRLHLLSGNQCAVPGCSRSLIASDGETIISKICHIEAAGEDGPRYNPAMSDDDRRHFNNLILLCDEHHSIIDNKVNEAAYTVSTLKELKKNHENKLLHKKIISNYSLLKLAIDAIAEIDFDESDDQNSVPASFYIEDKISYNAIKRNKPLIDEYKIFYSRLNGLYSELEIQGSFKKNKLLQNIKRIYLKFKGKYVGDSPNVMDLVRANADNIIEDIEQELMNLIERDSKYFEEDITFGVSIIMVDAFMRCKILEEPK
jgi:hypothetical protein